MTTLSNFSMTMPPSPRAMMDRRIDAALETGSVSQIDSVAMEAALDSIDTALSPATSEEAGRLDPSTMQDRIDSLIEDQVSAGTLTQEQAAQLQSMFAQGPEIPSFTDNASGVEGIDGVSGMEGAGPMRGPPPGPPPAASEEEDGTNNWTSGLDTASATDQLDSIIAFLDNLRASLSQSLYGSGTSSSAASNSAASNSGLIIDGLA